MDDGGAKFTLKKTWASATPRFWKETSIYEASAISFLGIDESLTTGTWRNPTQS